MNKFFNKQIFRVTFIAILFFGTQSCEESFLDIVPDNVATVDQAFNLREEAEKYLATCYSYMPRNGDAVYNIAMLAGDELWIPEQDLAMNSYAFDIARGLQRIDQPYMDAWEGFYQGAGPNDNYPLFDGIRHCNIFIENLENPDRVPDITEAERQRWIAEGKFLKAYYHFYLMRMYGPIPVMRENIPIDAPDEELNVSREPIDPTVEYLVELLDEAAPNLPPSIISPLTEKGRITEPIARALKAKILVTAASPLFNGNEDMAGFTTADGEPFFNTSYDARKWTIAAEATKEAIDAAEAGGHSLYTFPGSAFELADTTEQKLSIRQALTQRESPEVVWPNTQSLATNIQRQCMSPLTVEHGHRAAEKSLSAPIGIARMFYSENGVPINEDKTLDFTDIDQLRTATEEERNYIQSGYETARLNFDREPRFYADLGFDGAIWYKYDASSNDEAFHIESKYQDYAGSNHAFFFNVTGYYIKKLVNWEQSFTEDGANYRAYAWPEIRLADLYLLYAEALNEAEGPSQEVYNYINRIRERAGLDGVVESWNEYSVNPGKPSTQEGLREIIHRERNIELAFEGHRFWDILRWKEASTQFNDPIQGWNVYGENNAEYYQIRTLHQQRFVSPRDYFWPLNQNSIFQNPNLVQNPGW